MTAIEVDRRTARRFVLGKQGLWPGRRWQGKDGARAAMRAVEHLQLDPLVIVARSHDLMLHARVTDYHADYFHQLAYEDREFFDWGGWLAVRPMDELPHWRVLMDRNQHFGRVRDIADQHPETVAEMRRQLQEGRQLSSRDFEAGDKQLAWNYRGSKESSLALYYLWRVGEAMTHHRAGFERVYASAESVVPSLDLLVPSDPHEAELFIARKEIAHLGIGRFKSMGILLGKTISPAEHQALERELLERGEAAEVSVEGTKGLQYMLAGDVPLLERVAAGEVPFEWIPIGPTSEDEVALLSPLDPVSARGRSKALFGFEYVWEIYKKPEDVKYGRFTMPILWGDDLVGRIDLKTDRASNVLVVNGAWLEHAELARDERFTAALGAGVRRLARFVGAKKVDASAVANRTVRAALHRAR